MHVYVYSAVAPEKKINVVMRNVFHSYGNIVVVLFGLVQYENSPYLTVYRILRCYESRCVKLDIVEQNHLQHGQIQEGGQGVRNPPWKITSGHRFPYKYWYEPPQDAIRPIASRGSSVRPSVKYFGD